MARVRLCSTTIYCAQFRPDRTDLRKVSALLGLGDGRMLLGTPDHGLLVTDTKSLSVFHPEFAQIAVSRLAGTPDALWVGTRKSGAWLWQAGEVSRFEAELPDPQVLSLEIDGPRAWVGTPLGVAEFVNGKFSRKLAGGVFAQAVALLPETGEFGRCRWDAGHWDHGRGHSAGRFEGRPAPAATGVGCRRACFTGSTVLRPPSAVSAGCDESNSDEGRGAGIGGP